MRLSEKVEKRLEGIKDPVERKTERVKECVKAMKKLNKNFDPVKAGWPVGKKRKTSGKKRKPKARHKK